MSDNDILQYLFFTGVGSVALLVLWYVFIKGPQSRTMMLEPWARKRGLGFTPPISLGSHTTGHEVSVLQGNVQGVPLMLRSSRLVNSRRAGIDGTTEIMLRSFAPAPVMFSTESVPGPIAPTPNTVRTGDPMFDANVHVRSDNLRAAGAWLNPHLRSALFAVVKGDAPVACTYANGEITIRLGSPIWDEPQLDRALAFAVAAAHARLG